MVYSDHRMSLTIPKIRPRKSTRSLIRKHINEAYVDDIIRRVLTSLDQTGLVRSLTPVCDDIGFGERVEGGGKACERRSGEESSC